MIWFGFGCVVIVVVGVVVLEHQCESEGKCEPAERISAVQTLMFGRMKSVCIRSAVIQNDLTLGLRWSTEHELHRF